MIAESCCLGYVVPWHARARRQPLPPRSGNLGESGLRPNQPGDRGRSWNLRPHRQNPPTSNLREARSRQAEPCRSSGRQTTGAGTTAPCQSPGSSRVGNRRLWLTSSAATRSLSKVGRVHLGRQLASLLTLAQALLKYEELMGGEGDGAALPGFAPAQRHAG
jgi:hypothetical protein